MITFTLEMTRNDVNLSQTIGTGLACAALRVRNLDQERYRALDMTRFKEALVGYNNLLQALQRTLVRYHSQIHGETAAQVAKAGSSGPHGTTAKGSGVTPAPGAVPGAASGSGVTPAPGSAVVSGVTPAAITEDPNWCDLASGAATWLAEFEQ